MLRSGPNVSVRHRTHDSILLFIIVNPAVGRVSKRFLIIELITSE